MKVDIPFLSNAPSIWAFYFQAIALKVNEEMLKFWKDAAVETVLDSIDPIKPENAWEGFSSDTDYLVVRCGRKVIDKTSDKKARLVWVTFSETSLDEGIRFDFAQGYNSPEVSYQKISQMKFSAKILEDERVYSEMAKWFGRRKIATAVFTQSSCKIPATNS